MMRLQTLGLDLFGHFTGKSIEFGDKGAGASDFHLIYGPNEAGKTTIMEGFLRLLYGFPHRESYAFKHSRANLQVSGTLQFDDTLRSVTRLPSQKNNLVDASGTPLPEAVLRGALSGLSLEDYKQLLCLDDLTIEKGGEEIANSKGDIGRLLFSAAAGVSDLSEVLDASKARSDALYKKGGSKSEYAQLKRALDEVNTQIRAKDINVTEYRKRKLALVEVETAEAEARARRLELMARQTKLTAQSEALSKHPAIVDLERQLVPLDHYPAQLDIDPEGLVRLSKQRAVLGAEQTRLRIEIQEKTAERNKIEIAPEAPMSIEKLEDLKELRSRCGHAAMDLPRRRAQRDDIVKTMQISLAKGGFGEVSEPEIFAIEAELLGILDDTYHATQNAKNALETAQKECVNAQKTYEEAHSTLNESLEDEGGKSSLRDILDQQDAQQTLADFQKNQEAIRLARRRVDQALSLLSVNGKNFSQVPPLPLRADDAKGLERAIEAATLALSSAEFDAATAQETEEKLAAQINFQETSGVLISDEEAQATRQARDTLWQSHIGVMSNETAHDFENAMRLDDAKSEARHGQAEDLGELRQLKALLCDAQITTRAKGAAFEAARVHLANLHTTLEGHLSAIGLSKDMSIARFSDWMRLAEAAEIAVRDLHLEGTSGAAVLKAAQALEATLAQALDVPNAKLPALVALASKIAGEQERVKVAQQAARKALSAAEKDLAKRQDHVMLCENALSTAQAEWAAAMAQIPTAQGQDLRFPQAFAAFREVRELVQKMSVVTRQIEAMEEDEAMLSAAMKQLSDADPALQNLPVTETFDAVAAVATLASQAQGRRRDLSKALTVTQGKLTEVDTSLAGIDAQVALIAKIFPQTIPVDTIDTLREAVLQGDRAIIMREQKRTLVSELCTILEVGTRAEAEALLAPLSLSAVEALRHEAEQDLLSLEGVLTTAIEERTQAQAHLKAIGGDDEVAALNGRKQTLELEMENVARQYLELRLGHMLADSAIRRYRDTHRSAMMKAAEVAFSELTNGAYRGLSSQIDGVNESLVAIQTSDNAAKKAQDMSKGTRFQLYLALRAAAYEQMASNGTVLPFLCDDIFETFDESRTRSACKLLRRIGNTGQAIYLTHHQHVVEIAQDVCGEDVKVHRI